MALLVRIYFNAVFGAVGGLLGWVLLGVFYNAALPERLWWLVGGALIGGNIGYFVVSVEAIRDLSLPRFCRLASYGVLVGALGGAVGMWVAEEVNTFFVDKIGSAADWHWYHVFEFMLTRGISLSLLGLAVGMSEGIAARSLGRLSYGTLGGAIGGFIGGSLFGLCYYVAVLRQDIAVQGSTTSYFFSALGLVILGACIGSLSALVQGVFQPASLRVLRGWQEGREYPLLKPANSVGRDEHADIALFRDMRVEKQHVSIQRQENRYILVNTSAPAEQTRVNDAPVTQSQDLHDGDRIQLGSVVLRFQLRAAQTRKKEKV